MCRTAFGDRLAVTAAALVLTALPANAEFKLYDTGTDNAGNLLAVTAPDPHWTITNPNNVVTTPIHEFSYPNNWVNEVTTPGNATGWIRPNDTDLANFPGVFPAPGHVRSYKTTFDLTGYDPTTAFINLRWAMDDVTTGIILNGNLVPGSTIAPLHFGGWNPITINSGFVSGINTLEFKVGNVDFGAGMIVDFLNYGAQPCGNWVAGRDMAANEGVTATETQNPNATVPEWSYGYRSTLASSTLAPFTSGEHSNNLYTAAGLDGFVSSSVPSLFVGVNSNAFPLVRPGMMNLNPSEIEQHPGPNLELSVVRWTAPVTGTYSISASWRDINASNGNGASGNIVLNGTLIFRKVWANGGPGVSASFPSVSLAAGDHLDFVVGAESDYNSDSTAFDATIAAVTAPQTAPVGFTLIPGGTFAMGDEATAAPTGDADEVPHTVNVSAFYMAASETTRAQWDETTAWIATSGLGYDIGSAGASSGTAHPMQSVSWWHAVKWCNARSEQKGLTPCYTDGVGGPVVRSGTPAGIVCDFTKNGYRLPTESEWEKAARGGIAGRRFSIGDTLAHSDANYVSDHASAYDVSSTSGYHPLYSGTFTAPVGSFLANPYGLHDLEGNVWEWCWDWYNTYPSSGSLNPQGVLDAGYPERVIRGGAWNFNAFMARSANRDSGLPAQVSGHIGFRLALTAIVDPVMPATPEISVSGNAVVIADGDTTPTTTDHTDFGSVISCTGTVTRTFSITNNNPCADLLLNGTPQPVTLSGPDASQFSIIVQPSLTTVGPGDITTFQIRFNPTNVGLCTATVTIPNNDPNEAPYDFVIEGTAMVSTDACVATTTLSAGAYSPAWVPTSLGDYALGVSNATIDTTVTAVPLHPCSTMQVRINGGAYATLPSGTASAALPLDVGTNTINIRVTAQDGTTIKIYTIIVTRSEPLPTIPCPVNLGLKNTGVDATGALLPAGAIDPGYVLEATALPTYVTSTSSAWLPNTALSQWISYQPNGGNDTAGGTYSYRQTFSLVGFNPIAVQITGRFASDNGSTLYLNGTQIAATPASSGSFTAWTNFTITTGFAAQQNTLEFRVTNDNIGVGSGLRVEMTASAAPVSPQVAWQTYQTAVNAAVSDPADSTAIIAFPSGDHDHDGLSNYLEIALGTAPISGSSMPQLTPYLAPLAGSGSAQQRLHLSAQVPAAVGIPVTCVASGDLVTWVPALQVSSVPGNPGFNLVTWVAPASMPLDRAFMRLAAGTCH